MKKIAAALFVVATFASCNKGKMKPAPPPFRPKVVGTPGPEPVDPTQPTDCEPAKDTLASLSYGERSIPESEGLAREGVAKLTSAEGQGIDEPTRQGLVKDAVDSLIAALIADPYNVSATYNLAAAYARIDRPQCSINMLQRMIQMRGHPSKKNAVDDKLDRLLGRKKQTLDPDFKDLRTDPRFRELISSICSGTDDPGCVSGKR